MMLDDIKTGDRLKLRDDLIEGQQYGNLTLWPNMYNMRGSVFTVKYISGHSRDITVEENSLYWNLEMFEIDGLKPVSLSNYLL